jgi:hypothetical protein
MVYFVVFGGSELQECIAILEKIKVGYPKDLEDKEGRSIIFSKIKNNF